MGGGILLLITLVKWKSEVCVKYRVLQWEINWLNLKFIILKTGSNQRNRRNQEEKEFFLLTADSNNIWWLFSSSLICWHCSNIIVGDVDQNRYRDIPVTKSNTKRTRHECASIVSTPDHIFSVDLICDFVQTGGYESEDLVGVVLQLTKNVVFIY